LIKESSSFIADPKLIAELETHAQPVVPASDGILFHQGDAPIGVFILRSGTITMTMNASSDRCICTKVGAGSILGLPAVVGAQPYSLTAVAQQDSHVLFVKSEDFVSLMRSKPAISFHVLQILAQEVRAARGAYSELVDASH
jgi:CRP/FNR family transcriptional regulator